MKMKIENRSILSGVVDSIPSKSYSHRYLIGSALAHGASVEDESSDDDFLGNGLSKETFSEDVLATYECLSKLLNIIHHKRTVAEIPTFQCNNSGSTLRILSPILMVFFEKVRFVCGKQLIGRNMPASMEPLKTFGVDCYSDGDFLRNSIVLDGNLKAGEIHLDDAPTSQVVSGLLMALPLLKKNSCITISEDFPSMPYVDMTLNTLKDFGVNIEKTHPENDEKSIKFNICGNQKYKTVQNISNRIENDWSNSAFWIVANFIYDYSETTDIDLTKSSYCEKLLNYPIKVCNLNSDSLQGDREILNILWDFKRSSNSVTSIDCSNIPDVFPVLALASGVLKDSVTEFTNLERLSLKESNRIESTVSLLNSLDIKNRLSEHKLKVYGSALLKNGIMSKLDAIVDNACEINTYGDHRIAMTAGIASIFSNRPLILSDYVCVKKSYPGFWKDFKKLGGKCDKIQLR